MKFPPPRSIGLFVLCITIPLLIGAIGSFFTLPQIAGWYARLHKPMFNPPNWIFGPVWTILYLMMGVSLWLIIQKRSGDRVEMHAKFLFAAQLIANLGWSLLFFGLHQFALSLIEIFVLLGLIVATTLEFKKINTTAAWLLLPYLCWTCFATVLTAAIWYLNG